MAEARNEQRKTLFTFFVGKVFGVAFWLVLSLFISIIIEWLGMTFFWAEEGISRSQQMFVQEIQYINEGITNNYMTFEQGEFVLDAHRYYQLAVNKSGIDNFMGWIKSLGSGGRYFSNVSGNIHDVVEPYYESALITAKIFSVRLAILIMSWPSFVIAFMVGATDGLVERDLRKWGGGRESSDWFQIAQYCVVPLAVASWVIYLSIPFSINPSFVIIPFAILFGFAVRVMFEKLKKYF